MRHTIAIPGEAICRAAPTIIRRIVECIQRTGSRLKKERRAVRLAVDEVVESIAADLPRFCAAGHHVADTPLPGYFRGFAVCAVREAIAEVSDIPLYRTQELFGFLAAQNTGQRNSGRSTCQCRQ
jgi:hypothetical protein